MADLPKAYQKILDDFPSVAKAYQTLGDATHQAGPLSERERRLVKLALAIGAGQEGGVHSHVRKCLEAGLQADELRQVTLLAITSIGFSPSVAAMTWIEDELET
jgi:alkylhydroperoxidase/carboxymuconolactone decarboxylase family protein YurZ